MPPTFALIDGERLVRDSLATCLVAGAPGARIAYAGPSAIEAAAALHGAPEPCALVRDSGGRAQALEQARLASGEEQAREQLERFLAPGSGYQPGSARMFYRN